MTLVWLGFGLAVVLAGLTFAMWDVRFQSRKQQRVLTVRAERRARATEDRAWATSRHVEYQRAMSITATRANLVTADDLIDALSRPSKPQLDVVA